MSDGSNKPPTVGPSVFMPQKHPELRQLGSKAIQTFLQQREQYLLKAEDPVAQCSSYQFVSLVNSVDFKLFKALVAFDTFKNVNTVTELTDDVLSSWLTFQIEDTATSNTREELETLVKKNVRIKVREPDPKIRLMSLFMDYYNFLEERNLKHLIEQNTKVAVKHICTLLNPAAFKQKIENDLALEGSELKKDWKASYAYVIENAVAFEAFFASVVQAAADPKMSEDQDDDRTKRSPRRGSKGRHHRGGRRKPSDGGLHPLTADLRMTMMRLRRTQLASTAMLHLQPIHKPFSVLTKTHALGNAILLETVTRHQKRRGESCLQNCVGRGDSRLLHSSVFEPAGLGLRMSNLFPQCPLPMGVLQPYYLTESL